MTGQYQVYSSVSANDCTNNCDLDLYSAQDIPELFPGSITGVNQHLGYLNGHLQPCADAQVSQAFQEELPHLSSGSNLVDHTFQLDHSVLSDETTTSFNYSESTLRGTRDTMMTDMEVATLPAFEAYSGGRFDNLLQADSSVSFQSTQQAWNYYPTPVPSADINFALTGFQQNGFNSQEVPAFASRSTNNLGIQNPYHQMDMSGLSAMRNESFGSPVTQCQTRQYHMVTPSTRIIDRLLDKLRLIQSGQPLKPSEITGLSLLIGDEYDKVSAWLTQSESSGNSRHFESIISPMKPATSNELPTRNRATATKAFRITKGSNSAKTNKAFKSHRSRAQNLVRGWDGGSIPSSVFDNAAELSRQNINSCIRKLTPEELQENLQKSWDPNKPYSCPLLCGAAYKSPSDFERHEHQNRPQHGYVCNLPRIVRGPAGPCCSFCGHLNPTEAHFQVIHKDKKACRDNKLQLGGKGSRVFPRVDHFKQHFANIHRGFPLDAYLKTAYFEVKNNFRPRCGFCGVHFSDWNDQISHLQRQLKRGHPLSEWREPWVGPIALKNCPDVDDSDSDEDNDADENNESSNGSSDDDLGQDHWTENREKNGDPSSGNQQIDRDDYNNPSTGSENSYIKNSSLGPISSLCSLGGNSEAEQIQGIYQDKMGFDWYLHFQSICGHQFLGEERRESRVPLVDVERIALHLIRHRSSPLAIALRRDYELERLEKTGGPLCAIFLFDDSESLLFNLIPKKLLERKSLGHGGSSLVDEVRLPRVNRILAMKTSKNRDAQRVLKEECFLRAIRHRHIVEARGFVLDGHETSILIEPVADLSLQQLLEGPDLKSNLHLENIACISTALQYIHNNGMIHCDLKPSNILIKYQEPTSSWLISDFGSSQMIDKPRRVEYTRKYAAPEVISGCRVSSRSDIFSLGCIILQCLAAVCDWRAITSITCSCDRLADIHLWLYKDALSMLKSQTIIAVDEKHIRMIRRMISLSEGARPAISEILSVFVPFGCCLVSQPVVQSPFATRLPLELTKVVAGDHSSEPSPKSGNSTLRQVLSRARLLNNLDMGYSRYNCQPLKEQRAEIRLLKLLAPKDGRITCEICTTSLDSHVPMAYEALSYAWGTGYPSASILVDEKPFKVTENLYKALQALQPKDSSRFLWIDAICINQEDFDERSSQVKIMGKIYRMATNVIVWLGDLDDINATCLTPDAILRTRRRLSQLKSHQVESSDFLTSIDLSTLLSRPWFSRCWVIQEIACASRASVQCGERNISWESFAAACESFSEVDGHFKASIAIDSGRFIDQIIPGLNSLELIDTLSRPLRQEIGLLELLERTWNRKASDPRDKIYALISLVPASFMRLGFRPDYRKSVDDVYTEFAIALLQDSNIDLLSFCEPSTRSSELPSWVPDFSLSINPRITMPSFSAGSGKPTLSNVLFCDRASGLLHIGGVLFDLVDYQWHDKLDSQRGYRVYDQFCQKVLGYENESIRREARWRTLIADHAFTFDGTHQRATRLMELGYRFWLDNDTRYEKEGARYGFMARRSGRVLFTTMKGYVGLGPQKIQSRDSVVVLAGARVPFILRKNDNGTYRLIGECYVHGIMDGEVMASNPEIRTYRLQ